MDNTIKRLKSNGVMTVILNRPEKLNACNSVMYAELLDVLEEADTDDSVRAVIFTGEGRAFCAGGELPEKTTHTAQAEPAATLDDSDTPEDEKGGVVALRMFRSLKPLIAAVNGAAIGFGATLILPMDMRLASTKSRFSFPFVGFGGVPEATASWFLPRAVGMATALEWCLTGDVISAELALQRGLVRSLHEPDELLDSAHAIAQKIAAKAAPVSAALTRNMLWRLSAEDHPEHAHVIESRLIQQRMPAADMREGLSSFFEKRPPAFPNRVSADLPPGFPWWQDR